MRDWQSGPKWDHRTLSELHYCRVRVVRQSCRRHLATSIRHNSRRDQKMRHRKADIERAKRRRGCREAGREAATAGR